ncbi:MAG: hypothetical protein QW607_01805 [Desulfurococcaceae archaeon]
MIKEMNERYKERRIKNFEEIFENLRALRRERYRDEQIRINTNSEQFHTKKLDTTSKNTQIKIYLFSSF